MRLPQALTPEFQTLFRKIRERLPSLFSPGEHRRYIQDLHSLQREALVTGTHGPGGSTCSTPPCKGGAHGTDQYYEELAEAFIGRVFLYARWPEELKKEFIDLLKMNDHIVEARLGKFGHAIEIADTLAQRDAKARRERQWV